ncbi:MAG: hypothetical protein ABFC94_01715, partial [Syntrophomonas sp.]
MPAFTVSPYTSLLTPYDKKGEFFIIIMVDVQPPELFNRIHDLIRMGFPDWELQPWEADQQSDYMVIKNIDFGNNLEISGSLKIGDKITDTKENPVISSVGPERK